VLRNASVQLTISKGRITSLLDVQLGCVLCFLFDGLVDLICVDGS
jgi:hypothetical protein